MTDKKMSAFDKINFIRAFDDGEMSGVEKSLLNIITSHLGDNDFAFIGLTTLQQESCIRKRQSIINNLSRLFMRGYITILKPSDGYKSNRYIVEFEFVQKVISNPRLLVTVGNYTSYRRSLHQLPTVTTLVTHGNPNRKIKAFKRKRKEKENPFFSENQNQTTYVNVRNQCKSSNEFVGVTTFEGIKAGLAMVRASIKK